MARAEEPRSKVIGAVLFWLFCLLYSIAVLLTEHEISFGGNHQLSERASDVVAIAIGVLSAWALWVWGRRLVRS